MNNQNILTPDENKIEELLHKGDAEALDLLLAYAARLEAIISKKFDFVFSEEDIKDIIAGALLTAFKRGKDFDSRKSKILTWLSMISHYEALMFLRRNRIFTDTTLDELANTITSKVDTELVTENPSTKMESALEKINPRRAQAIRLHYYNHLAIDEIADLFGISVNGTRSLLSRARDDLREILDEETNM